MLTPRLPTAPGSIDTRIGLSAGDIFAWIRGHLGARRASPPARAPIVITPPPAELDQGEPDPRQAADAEMQRLLTVQDPPPEGCPAGEAQP
jgi:hypothetical protein